MKTIAASLGTLVILGLSGFVSPNLASAANFTPFNMMSPGKWFGQGNRNGDYYYDDRGYGYPGPYAPVQPGYGYGPPGYGYAPQGYGYGAPGHGYPQPGSTYNSPPPAAPAADSDSQERIRELEQRIRELEASQLPPPVPAAIPPKQGSGLYSQPGNPVFRPE